MYLFRDCFLPLLIVALALTADLALAEKIRVASSSPSLTARLPHFVAHEEGFFTREGLQVESIVVRNDATILAALAAGEFDYVETGAPPAVAGISKGLPFVIIGGFRSRLDYMLIGRKGISSTKDLKGAKIGVTGAGGLSEAVAIAAMKKLGYQRDKDYVVLYVGNSPLRMIALEQGRVDASIFSPQQQMVLASKGYPMLTDVGRLLPDIPALVLSTTREKTKSQPDQVVRFLRAINQAMNVIKNDPDRAVEDARKQKYSGDFKTEREALKYYYDSFSIAFNAANVESLIDLSGSKVQMKPGDFFDSSFGAKAQR
jgi:NitT/TauT family transport system substrate-binding protein